MATSHRWAVRVSARVLSPFGLRSSPSADVDGRTPRVRPHPLAGRHRREQAQLSRAPQPGHRRQRPQGRPGVGRSATVLLVTAGLAAIALTPLATASSALPAPPSGR